MPIFRFIGYILMDLFRKPDNWQEIYKPKSSFFYASNIYLKRVQKKKLLGRHNKDISLNTLAKWLFNHFLKMQKQPPEVFYKKAVVKNLAIIKEKHLCLSLFSIQNIAKFLRPLILKSICKRPLLKMPSWNSEKLEIVRKAF